MDQNAQLTLPNSVISPIDIARMLRESEGLDEFFRQTELRGNEVQIPRYSRLLDEVVAANKLNLVDQTNREWLIATLRKLYSDAPVLHVSFSADPPGKYVQQIVSWLRANIHGQVLVRVGLQPNIGAGCIVRSTNKTFDFSLRGYFDSKKDFFAKKLHDAVRPDIENFDPPEQQPVVKNDNIDQAKVTAEAQSEQDAPQKSSVAMNVVNESIAPKKAPEALDPSQPAPVSVPVATEPEQQAEPAEVQQAPEPAPEPENAEPAPETVVPSLEPTEVQTEYTEAEPAEEIPDQQPDAVVSVPARAPVTTPVEVSDE